MPRRDVVVSFLIAIVAAAALFATTGCETLRGLFGPPAVDLGEQYVDSGDRDFDHAAFDAILRAHVDAQGLVDYAGLAAESRGLDDYIDALARADFAALTRDAKLAVLINAYNAWTLRLILDHWPLESIKDIPAAERWNAERFEIAGQSLSLDALEHQWLRKRFVEPRMHFAINCASIGCPPLRAEAYRTDQLDAQLADQCRIVHTNGSRWFTFDTQAGTEGATLGLTQIYRWFGGDFEQVAGSVLAFAGRFNARLAKLLDAGDAPAIRWLDYDWGINVSR